MVKFDEKGQGYWDFILANASPEFIETVEKIIKINQNKNVRILKAYEHKSDFIHDLKSLNVVLETRDDFYFLSDYGTRVVEVEKICKSVLAIIKDIKGGKLLW